jgi:hypothetical protein
MKDRIERYSINCAGNPDGVAREIEGVGGTLYEVHRGGLVRAGLSRMQKSDLEEKSTGNIILTPDPLKH